VSKLLVTDSQESTTVPFMRGILTRSLMELGLSFEDSYDVASTIRQELGAEEVDEVTTIELRDRVVGHLDRFGEEVVHRYQHPLPTRTVLVHHAGGGITTYSRGRHAMSLMACALTGEEASLVAAGIFDTLVETGQEEITSDSLQRLTHTRLLEDLGELAARRYLLWSEFQNTDRPLVLLIGGTAGCGKSTIATDVAHVLEIVRTQSTDMLREVMRTMVPERLLPVLHTSSYRAWEALPQRNGAEDTSDSLLAGGYLTQVELVSVACEAVLQRALKENVSVILEGVHVHPSLVERIPADSGAIVVPIMMGVLKRRQLENRIRGRGQRMPGRRSQRYLDNFDAIWRLQSFLLSEADRMKVPIIRNNEKEWTTQQVIQTILLELSHHFEGKPETAFRSA